MHLTVGYLIQVVYAFRLNLIPFCFLAGGVPATGNASILFCFFDSFLIFCFLAGGVPARGLRGDSSCETKRRQAKRLRKEAAPE